VQYVRESRGSQRGQLRGAVVAVLDEKAGWKVGWSYCHRALDRFDKKVGVEIALGRCRADSKTQVPFDVQPILAHMRSRAERYFKS